MHGKRLIVYNKINTITKATCHEQHKIAKILCTVKEGIRLIIFFQTRIPVVQFT
jgi:hypothetical protein